MSWYPSGARILIDRAADDPEKSEDNRTNTRLSSTAMHKESAWLFRRRLMVIHDPALMPRRFLPHRSPRQKAPVACAAPTRVSQAAGALLCALVIIPDFEHPSGGEEECIVRESSVFRCERSALSRRPGFMMLYGGFRPYDRRPVGRSRASLSLHRPTIPQQPCPKPKEIQARHICKKQQRGPSP